MQLHKDSHVDHGLTAAQLAFVLQHFADRAAFFLETIELPEDLGTVPCGLYGPLMGDAPVAEASVQYVRRGDRLYSSRVLIPDPRDMFVAEPGPPRFPATGPPRTTRLVTVIAGPHADLPCVLFTAFGGPLAPQEPGDPTCKDVAASTEFWAEHALTY